MKMILLITNKEDVTVDFVVQRLKESGLAYYRFNTEDVPDSISICFSANECKYQLYDKKKGQIVDLSMVSSVYFRRPKISSLEYISNITQQERLYLRSELSFCMEGIYKVLQKSFWINNVFRIREAENKIYQLQLAHEIGFYIPDSVISNDNNAIEKLFNRNSGNCIIKPIKSGNIQPADGSRLIFTSQVDSSAISNQARVASFPIYMQNNIEKAYDIRCIVIGDKIFAAKIDSQSDNSSKVDWRRSAGYLPHERITLPLSIQEKAITITQRLGLVYSAIDFVLDKNGKYIFLECNPNGQWGWIEKRLNFPISSNIASLLCRGKV